MDFFRRHYKLVVWIMIGSFLLYLIPSAIFVVTAPSNPPPERPPVAPSF
jgi:hypothetical protein